MEMQSGADESLQRCASSMRPPQRVGGEGKGNSKMTTTFHLGCLVTSKGTGKSGRKMRVSFQP